MAVELVIKIDEEKLRLIKKEMYCGLYDYDLYKAIANGTPLPKGHGRLIDADLLRNQFPIWIDNFSSYVVNNTISKTPKIIEADKRESEE